MLKPLAAALTLAWLGCSSPPSPTDPGPASTGASPTTA
jgi:hypothetical protein